MWRGDVVQFFGRRAVCDVIYQSATTTEPSVGKGRVGGGPARLTGNAEVERGGGNRGREVE